jgi:hypothetical protein
MSGIRYLNVDLEIESKEDLTLLIKEFGENVILLYHEKLQEYDHASFEISTEASTNEDDPDTVIVCFCNLIEQLPNEAKILWERCSIRKFDIGYESGESPQSYRSTIRASTIQRVSKIGAGIVITIYPGCE